MCKIDEKGLLLFSLYLLPLSLAGLAGGCWSIQQGHPSICGLFSLNSIILCQMNLCLSWIWIRLSVLEWIQCFSHSDLRVIHSSVLPTLLTLYLPVHSFIIIGIFLHQVIYTVVKFLLTRSYKIFFHRKVTILLIDQYFCFNWRDFFALKFIYAFERQLTERRRDREVCSTHWFAPQVASMAGTSVGGNQESGNSSRSPPCVVEVQTLQPFSVAFPRTLTGSWMKNRTARTNQCSYGMLARKAPA